MNGFIPFLKKETIEYIRSFKWWILLGVFFLLGMMSPLLAKLLPEIISGMEMEGMVITLSEPTYLDAYAQLFINISQLGYVIVLLIFGGMLSSEISKGTLVMILAKGLSRNAVILSKFVMALFIWTVSFLLTVGTTLVYTVYLFDEIKTGGLPIALFCLWLFGAFILALLLFSSTVAPGGFGGLILTASLLILLLIVNVIPKIKEYNPVTLAQDSLAIVEGSIQLEDRILTIGVTLGIIGILLLLSLQLFNIFPKEVSHF